jgi:hypothetical protein
MTDNPEKDLQNGDRINRRKFFGDTSKKLLLASLGAKLILPASAEDAHGRFNLISSPWKWTTWRSA